MPRKIVMWKAVRRKKTKHLKCPCKRCIHATVCMHVQCACNGFWTSWWSDDMCNFIVSKSFYYMFQLDRTQTVCDVSWHVLHRSSACTWPLLLAGRVLALDHCYWPHITFRHFRRGQVQLSFLFITKGKMAPAKCCIVLLHLPPSLILCFLRPCCLSFPASPLCSYLSLSFRFRTLTCNWSFDCFVGSTILPTSLNVGEWLPRSQICGPSL